MARRLVRDMSEQEYTAYKEGLRQRRERLQQMTPEERAADERRRNRHWSDAYMTKAYDNIVFRTPKGGREQIKSCAEIMGMTMNDFLRTMVYKGMQASGMTFSAELIFPPAAMPDEEKLAIINDL